MNIYILMGVSGVGKSTVGKILAKRLHLPFYDADDFHPVSSLEKMSAGQALEDKDREVWLGLLSEKIRDWNATGGAVIACSALKENYRKKLESIPANEIQWIFLHSDYDVILERIMQRKNHFFGPSLLASQYEVLEEPESAIKVNVDNSLENIVNEILQKIDRKEEYPVMGIIGLGVMGKSLALNLASKGMSVKIYNRQYGEKEVDVAKKFSEKHKEKYHFDWYDDIEKFVHSFGRPRNILLMVSAGKAIDILVDQLLPLLDPEDMIIDGGNSHYKDTIKREKLLSSHGIYFMGMGVSGGEEGALKGPSLMPGGEEKAYSRIFPVLEKIAARDSQGEPCCTYVGPGGAGHFVKMVHNGIEYAEMQLIAEIYHLLRFKYHLDPVSVSEVFQKWNAELKSFLLEISAEILRKREGEEYVIDKILDAAGQKGTGGWSSNAALELGVPLDTITAAVFSRSLSACKDERISASKMYGFQPETGQQVHLEVIFTAYQTASKINHAIGFNLLHAASHEYNWNLSASEIARIWTNGCIIRSKLMEEISLSFKERSSDPLLVHPKFATEISKFTKDLQSTVGKAIESGFPMPVMSAAVNYFLNYISSQSSANMIQAQRDYFGAHMVERTDKNRGELYHINWK